MLHDHCARCYLRRKSVLWNGIVEIVFGWGEHDYLFRQKKHPKTSVKFLTKHIAYAKFTSLVSYLCSSVASKIYNFLKTEHTTRMCGSREAHGCKNLAHTNKICPVKRTLMVATARITIRVFVTFSDCKESSATKPSRENMWGLNFPYAVIIKRRVNKWKAATIESSKAEQSFVSN